MGLEERLAKLAEIAEKLKFQDDKLEEITVQGDEIYSDLAGELEALKNARKLGVEPAGNEEE